MATAAQELAAPSPARRFSHRLARNKDDVTASLRLRHRVFIEEMGADAGDAGAGIESDDFDAHCEHLLVREEASGAIVASTRILTQEAAAAAGGFYSEEEFELATVLGLPGRFMEIGRTCVHPDYRRGAVIGVLWSGVSAFIRRHGYDHLIGCASIGLDQGMGPAHAIFARVAGRHLSAPARRVTPHLPLPEADAEPAPARLPPLLKAYLSLGATVGGPPCWDPAFGVADLFMHLDIANLCPRYARHFLRRDAGPTRRLELVS